MRAAAAVPSAGTLTVDVCGAEAAGAGSGVTLLAFMVSTETGVVALAAVV
jgi:hypothetical protein